MNARVTGDPKAPRKLNPNVSPQVEEIVLHAMEREPRNRYESAAEMKKDLDNPSAVQWTERCKRLQAPTLWKRSWKKVRWLALGVSIALAILFFVLWSYRSTRTFNLIFHYGIGGTGHDISCMDGIYCYGNFGSRW